MYAANSVNGYLIKQIQPGVWWITDSCDENIAGPFNSEQDAVAVASVLQDQPAAPVRRGNKKN